MASNDTHPCPGCGCAIFGDLCTDCHELRALVKQNPAFAAKTLRETASRLPSKEFQDVRDFHDKFELLRFDKPGHLSPGKLKERIEFMMEELLEFVTSCGLQVDVDSDNAADHKVSVTHAPLGHQDLAGQADALVDLVYVALGTAVMLGLPWDWLWDDVQRANMAKVRGVTKRGHAVDVTKPPGWQGPQPDRILHLAGYDRTEAHRDDTQRD